MSEPNFILVNGRSSDAGDARDRLYTAAPNTPAFILHLYVERCSTSQARLSSGPGLRLALHRLSAHGTVAGPADRPPDRGRGEWRIDAHLTLSGSNTHFTAGDILKEAGGRDVDFFTIALTARIGATLLGADSDPLPPA